MTTKTFLPELRWTASALPNTALSLVAIYSPEDDTVRAGGVAVPDADQPAAAAIGALLLSLMDRLAEVDPATADREMNPMPVEAGAGSGAGSEPGAGRAAPVAEALAAYAAGHVTALDGLAVAQPGSAFRQDAWEALRRIPAGAPRTYTQLADDAGRPAAVRASASACAQNLVAVVVPCHRVTRADGTPGQYLYGTPAKQALLAHEARHARSDDRADREA
ncbi:MAG: MGMT family protein [Micrococcus sp.]|nr:MGMT family protein [Micrococcus sp.]